MSKKARFRRSRIDEGNYRLLILIAKHYGLNAEDVINHLICDYNKIHVDSLLDALDRKCSIRQQYKAEASSRDDSSEQQPLEFSGGFAADLGGVGGGYTIDPKELAERLAELSDEKFYGSDPVPQPPEPFTLEECIQLSTIDVGLKAPDALAGGAIDGVEGIR